MTFNEFDLTKEILNGAKLAGYFKASPIQEQAIPLLLERKDLLGSAQTGTGKTAAFAIPILQNIYNDNYNKDDKTIKALILTPTRELANQVAENFIIYSNYLNIKTTAIYGGVPQNKQVNTIKKGVDILVATPGRLIDLMNQGHIKLNHVKYLVLDEADQMLDMGFINDVLKIVSKTNKERQTMLFSATMPKAIEVLSQKILKDPVRVSVTPVTKTLDTIKQQLYFVNKNNKTSLLVKLINDLNIKSLLVFTRTKHNANKLVKALLLENIKAEPIHGNKSQSAREKALSNFKKGQTKVLVATDIASRGIDIEKLDYVINYDLPETAETYIHRIGRTARAGLEGNAISFCEETSMHLLRAIETHIKTNIEVINNEFTIINPIPITKDKQKPTSRKTTAKKNKYKSKRK